MALGSKGQAYHTRQTHYIEESFDYEDTSIRVGTLPPGAVVINAGVVVTTAFNSGTSNVLDIGTSGDGDGFATDLDISTAGLKASDELATSNDLYATTDVIITATHTPSGTAATEGAGVVFVEYMVANPSIASTA